MSMNNYEKNNLDNYENPRLNFLKPQKLYNTNFTQIPKGMKDKLNLPFKGSTYLKNMINTKSNQTYKINTLKSSQKSNNEYNTLNPSHTNSNFKRSFSKNDQIGKNPELENLVNSGTNFYTSNFESNQNKIKSTINKNTKQNESRSKSNGRSKQPNNPMINLLKSYSNKNKIENPATYRKYRPQTNSTDKLYQKTAIFPVHVNPNDYNENNQSEHNINYSKLNDYDYHDNSGVYKESQKAHNGFASYNNLENKTSQQKKNSFNVLSEILDSQFSISSPNRNRSSHPESNNKNGENKNENLNNNQSINNNLSSHEFYKDKIYQNDEQNTKLTINLSYVGENPLDRYLEALEHIMTILDPIFDRLNFLQKLEKFIENVEDHRRSIRLGSLVGIYIFLKKFQIEDSHKMIILEKIIQLLQNYETQEELFLVACLEIADLASKDYRDYTKFILNSLINTPHIQRSVIIRALINEIYSNHPDKRHAALAALNRMHDLVDDEDVLNKISYFFKDPKIEKIFLASTLRTGGEKGEKILIKELKSNNDFSVRVGIASVFAYRTSKNPKYLEVRLDKNDTFSIAKTLPGSFCTYYGKISPLVHEQILTEQDQLSNNNNSANNTIEELKSPYEEYLEVNTRDFLAALQRLISINYNHQNPRLVHKGNYNYLDDLDVSNSKNDIFYKYLNFFQLENLLEGKINSQIKIENFISDAVENSKNLITEDAIKSVCSCLKDYSSAVRETAANTLAHIGLPEAVSSIYNLLESLKDNDVVVKSKVVIAIGKIAPGCENYVIPHVVEALKTNMWKVKLACLNTLSQFGVRASKLALPYLYKLLRESAINKQVIADTIVKLGYEGESILLKILTTEDDSNFKLKSVTAKALGYTDLNGPNLDFIIETLFKSSISENSLIRFNCLCAIKNLEDKSDDHITYLKKKNVIPFYYNKLTDKDLNIQTFAIDCIKSLGPQGELIFIEGMTKDSNPIIRANCAIGLANIGPHTIRTLLIGLHDENKEVRKIVEREITGKFGVYDIVDLFVDKNSQKLSLRIAIRDILEKCENLHPSTKTYFNDILMNLDRDRNNLDSKNQNVEINQDDKFPYENYEEENENNIDYKENEKVNHSNSYQNNKNLNRKKY